MNRQAVGIAAEILTPTQFYKPIYGNMFAAIIDLYEHGDPIDAVTVQGRASEMCLTLGTDMSIFIALQANVPSIANVREYCQIVERASVARNVMRAAQQALGDITDGGDPFVVADEMNRFTLGIGSKDVVQAAQTIRELSESDAAISKYVIPGLLAVDHRVIITARPGSGKALDIATPIFTPTGWTTMGALSVGDLVFDDRGCPTRVVAATDVMYDHSCYDVVFSDGSYLRADADHQWKVVPRSGRRKGTLESVVLTTEEMTGVVRINSDQRANFLIENTKPLLMSEKKFLIHPYILGVWLGDGHSDGARLSCADQGIIDELITLGQPVRKLPSLYSWSLSDGVFRGRFQAPEDSLQGRLRKIGVLNNKHIPREYFLGSLEQRLSLLQGLMDTDGYIDPQGVCEFTSTSRVLAEGALEIILSLGMKAVIKTGEAKLNGRFISEKHRISFQPDLCPVFRLPRKARFIREVPRHNNRVRYVTDIVSIESVPVRCIQVASESGCFLAGRNLIVTHNSTFLKFLGLCAAQGVHPFTHRPMEPARVLSVDAENPGESILSTMLPLEATLEKYSLDFDEERFKIFRSPGGLNIRQRRARTELQREIALHRPDIVVAGPIYKMSRREGGESYEQAAEDFVDILDDLRTKYAFALVLEGHPPKNSEEWTPMGSITLSNWAEVGMYLKKENPGDHHVTVGHFREDRLQGLGYPKSMEWDRDWIFNGLF